LDKLSRRRLGDKKRRNGASHNQIRRIHGDSKITIRKGIPCPSHF
jgi:hypothetical protein